MHFYDKGNMQNEYSQDTWPSQEGKRCLTSIQAETCRIKKNPPREEDKGSSIPGRGNSIRKIPEVESFGGTLQVASCGWMQAIRVKGIQESQALRTKKGCKGQKVSSAYCVQGFKRH